MTLVLSDLGEFSVEAKGGEVPGDDLWLDADDAAAATGWALQPEGFCRGDICVPVPKDRAQSFVADGKVNLAAFWDHMNMPAAHSRDGDIWALGEASQNRADGLRSLQAPDFTLPDLNGVEHSLTDHRGRKVLLATWASW